MPRSRQKVVLVFGEDDNDRSALVEIMKALRPAARVRFEKRAKPLVLVRQSERPATRRGTIDEIVKIVRATQVIDDVIAVVAHRDCDAVEPAHVRTSREIEAALHQIGVANIVAATPAFEMEAWWLLFPEALQATRSCWSTLTVRNRNVGMISNAKEFLIRSLRPNAARKNACPDYCESDSVRIAAKIRELGIVRKGSKHTSLSFSQFVTKIDAMSL